jgi:hypothetical protein
MGLKKLASSVAKTVATGGLNLVGGAINKATQGPQYQTPEIDPEVKALRDKQVERAKSFRSGMEGMRQEQQQQAEEQSRRGLAKDIAGNTQNYNARGLLFSGLKQGGEIDAQTESAASLAKAKTDINQNLENQAQALDADALGAASNVAQLNNQNLAMQQQINLQQQQSRNSGLKMLFGAGGQIAGGYLGGR